MHCRRRRQYRYNELLISTFTICTTFCSTYNVLHLNDKLSVYQSVIKQAPRAKCEPTARTVWMRWLAAIAAHDIYNYTNVPKHMRTIKNSNYEVTDPIRSTTRFVLLDSDKTLVCISSCVVEWNCGSVVLAVEAV